MLLPFANIQDLLSDGKTPYERRFGMPFNGPAIPFGAMVEYHHIYAKDQPRLHQFGPKVLPGIFLGYALFAEGIWKRDIMVADIEELEEMDASELHARNLNVKEVLTPQRSGNFIFPVADGTVKIFWRELRLRTSTLTRDCPERGEEQVILQRIWDELHSPTPLQDDSTRDEEEDESDFWTITGGFIYRHHVEPRVKLYVPQEESFLIPLKCIDVTRTTHTSLDVLLEKQTDDYWNVDGEREIIRCIDKRHKINFFERKTTGWIFMVGEGDLQENKQPQDQTQYGQICGSICLMQRKRKPKEWWAIEKPKLGNARQSTGILFIVPNDEEFKLTMKAARRKLEVPMPTAMPCKTPTNSRGETCRNIRKNKIKYACVVDADESMRIRLEGVPHRYHEDHIAAKRNKFVETLQFGT